MYISVDMGGTNTRVAGAIDLDTLCMLSEPDRQRNTGDYERDLNFIIDSAKKIAGRNAIKAVGIGTPGTPNRDRTRIASAVNLSHWNNMPLVEPIRDALDCDVIYGNDGEAGALGHAYYDARDDIDFHYLIWGTGIGGASIEYDADGEVTHISKLHWESHFKNWEQACSGNSLTKKYGAPENFTNQRWQGILRKFGKHLIEYVKTYEPVSIVFGGGLAVRHEKALYNLGASAGIDIAVNKNSIHGGFGLIRYDMTHGLSPVDETDIED